MAVRKIESDDIIKINELYLKYKTYAAVAREVGCAPSTVKKYIMSNFITQEQLPIIRFKGTIPKADTIIPPSNNSEWKKWLILSEEEKIECDNLRKEILI